MKSSVFKVVVILCLSSSSFQGLHAQRLNYFTLPALTDVSKVSWRPSIYRFPEFQKGKITYTKGFVLEYEFDLNYNIYYEKMDFIHSSGDTLSITNTREIQSIQVGNKTFFHDYNTGYYEILLPLPMALAFRNQFILENIEYSNGMKVLPSGSDTRGVAINYGRIYRKEFSYFFIDQDNKLHNATRASVLKLFPAYSTEIKGYLLEHRVDFALREDLIALTNYCNQFIDVHENESKRPSGALTVRLPGGKRLPDKKAMDSLYRFPEFQEAKVTWADKPSSFHPEKMNYNLFTGNMDVVDLKGDTVKFSRWQQTKIVNLDGDVFFKHAERGYLEILFQGQLSLAVKSNFTLVTDKVILEGAGLMDQASASDVSNKSSIANYDRLYQLQRTYFFIFNNQVHEATKLSILRLMTRDREEVIAYMNDNQTSLQVERDLMRLTSFCNSLIAKK